MMNRSSPNNNNSNSNQSADYIEKMQRCQDYIHGLEDERRKIQVFQRELPLCLELVTQAIEACKQQLSGTTKEYNVINVNGQLSECINSHNDQETSSEHMPVLEEFMPIKRTASSHSDNDDDDIEEEHESKKAKNDTDLSLVQCKDVKNLISCCDKNSKKSDWLRSVQLWNPTPDPPSNKEESLLKKVEVKRDGSGGAFHPFKKEKSATTNSPTPPVENRSVPPASTSSTAESGGGSGGNKKEDKEGNSQRKARRCWSPELHRRFLQALQQLGGAHGMRSIVATPKQIRELMKVDGLTNDEVKSHLQKYRLHTRRPSPPNRNNNNTQAPQFVVVGGLWMPPEYSTMGATSGEESGVAATSNGVYAPIAKLPPPFQESLKQKRHRDNDTEGEDQSHSPATSSSTHTTTASEAYN